jgi:hypothetical protein
LAVTLAPVVADKPVAGDHKYVVPPLAVRVEDPPLQIVTPDPALTVGIALTVTFTVIVAVAVPSDT